MTPDFVLSLFFEGIRLYRRTSEGWALVGEVPLDSPDLARDLHALRDAGIATGTPWTGTGLLLPPEQVRVLDLEGERDLAGVRAALEGMTPYAVGDLVLDWEVRDGRTHVAAVARETLEEAEAFAAEHGFLPVSFAAPLQGFPREADFGPTRLAATLPGAAASDIVAEPPSEEAPVPDATEELAPAEPVLANAALEVAPPTAQEADDIAASEAPKPATSDPVIASEPATPESAPTEQAATEPSGATPAALPPEAPSAEAEPTPPAEPAPAAAIPAADLPAGPGPSPLSAPGVPEPIFASRARPLRAERRDGARLSAASEAVRKAEGRRVEPSVRKPSMPPVAQGWALSAATAAARPDPRMPPRPVGATPHPPVNPQPEPAAVAAAVAEARRPAPLAAPQDVPRPAVLAAAASEPEPERRAAFGRRTEAPARPRGKPRFLGLILTILLLIVMAAVFAWASTTEQGLAGLFRRAEAPTAIAAAPPPEDRVAPNAATPEAIAAAPAPAPEPAPEAASEAAPEAVASVAPAAPPVPDAEDAAAAAAAVAAAMADLPRAAEPPPALETPAGADPADPLATAAAAPAPGGEDTAVPPAEADRFYAATGVWLRAPRLSLLSEADPIAVQASTIQSPSTGQAPAEPALLAAAAPDSRPEVQVEPATPAEGSAVADAGPALTPEAAAPDARVAFGPPAPPTPPDPSAEPAWVNAMAEPPDVLPPDRPEPPEGFAVATAEVQGPPAAPSVPAAGEWVNAMAEPPASLPPERPDAPADFLAALQAEQAAGPALRPGALAFAASPDAPAPGGVDLAGLRPTPRPEGFAPPPTILASFDGPRPGPRPEGLAPEAEVESPDVSGALAEALAAPEAPAAPDLQSTLAAIVEGAPDPLAGATPRAVAVARVPDARPRNFGQVVQRQLDRVARASQAPAAGGVATSDLTAQEQAESGEAEAASSAAAAPSGVTPTSVAQAATFSDAMRLREVNLIGVYGQPNARRALIRLANGRYVRVGVGDQFDGGQVTAIGDNALNYTRRGRTFQLVIPGG